MPSMNKPAQRMSDSGDMVVIIRSIKFYRNEFNWYANAERPNAVTDFTTDTAGKRVYVLDNQIRSDSTNDEEKSHKK